MIVSLQTSVQWGSPLNQTSPIFVVSSCCFFCAFLGCEIHSFDTTRQRRHPGGAWQHGHGPEDLPEQQLHRGDPSGVARQPLKSKGKSRGLPTAAQGPLILCGDVVLNCWHHGLPHPRLSNLVAITGQQSTCVDVCSRSIIVIIFFWPADGMNVYTVSSSSFLFDEPASHRLPPGPLFRMTRS